PSLLPLSILPHPPSPLPPPHSFPTRRSSDLSGEYKQYDCCLGSRFMRGSRIKGYSALRIFGNYGFNWLFSLVTLHKITDLGSGLDRKSTRLNSSHVSISYAVFCLKKKIQALV